jgi:hypothetical protein
VVQHKLARSDKTLQWTSVEALAVGRPAALIPNLPHDLAKDSTAFAARYANRKQGGESVGIDSGMVYRGVGASATVMQGALGARMRAAFHKVGPDRGIAIGGGFLGLLKNDTDAVAAPLLRLPILAGLGLHIAQCKGKTTIEVAWSDSAAARLVARTRGTAASPSSDAYNALTAALFNGQVDDESLVSALLVEQSFEAREATAEDTMESTPFFVAAAVSVHEVFASMPSGTFVAEALSLVSGTFHNTAGKPASLAAAVVTRDLTPVDNTPPRPARLYVLGDKIDSELWRGPQDPSGGESLAPLLRTHALRRVVAPRAYLLSLPDGTVRAGLIASLALDQVHAPAPAQPQFAEAARGMAAVPQDDNVLRWAAAPQEGPTVPIRDADDMGPWERSGLAGRTRAMHLPFHTGAAVALDARAAQPKLVWIAQTQIPIFLKLKTRPVSGPPVGWLNDAAPLVRLPADSEVANLLRTLDSSPITGRSVQPFLPAFASTTSVGERAGVLTLRRVRLLTRMNSGVASSIAAYDPSQPRFGAPGQAGMSFGRTLRTPRPGPLPRNVGDPMRDRRIHASAVHPQQACAAWLSTADIVQGGSSANDSIPLHAWTITTIASPQTNSIVNDRWDGAVRVVCHIELSLDDDAAIVETPLSFFGKHLMESEGAALRSRASLQVGDVSLPFRWLEIVDADASFAQQPPGDLTHYGATVVVVLDTRLYAAKENNSMTSEALAQVMRKPGPLPAIELQWTVHPDPLNPLALSMASAYALDVPIPGNETLASGSRRAPLTLRMPLFAVARERGALPLTQATVIFSDPAYDRDLASEPVSDANRLAITPPAAPLDDRGELVFSLSADRNKVQRMGVVTLMADIRYERPMADLAQAIADKVKNCNGGDIDPSLHPPALQLSAKVQNRDGKERKLKISSAAKVILKFATVCELPMSMLREENGAGAQLVPGDTLCLEAVLQPNQVIRLWNGSTGSAQEVTLTWTSTSTPVRTLRIIVTKESVIEPPPALYATLLRRERERAWQIAIPQHAQSPLPRRVDLVEPARGFRLGLMKRHADFVWHMSRPAADFGPQSLYIIKSDRNGQLYLPEAADEFFAPASALPILP